MQATIYQPSKTAMQSGTARAKHWLLEFAQTDSRFIEPLMGWTGSTDMTPELNLRFSSKEEAVAYAEANNIEYQLKLPQVARHKPKAYADNFK